MAQVNDQKLEIAAVVSLLASPAQFAEIDTQVGAVSVFVSGLALRGLRWGTSPGIA